MQKTCENNTIRERENSEKTIWETLRESSYVRVADSACRACSIAAKLPPSAYYIHIYCIIPALHLLLATPIFGSLLELLHISYKRPISQIEFCPQGVCIAIGLVQDCQENTTLNSELLISIPKLKVPKFKVNIKYCGISQITCNLSESIEIITNKD